MTQKLRLKEGCVLAFLILVFCIGKAFALSGEIKDISGREYFSTVKEAIEKAEKSIYMVMYVVRVDPRNTKSKVFQLCQSLIDAHDRGVDVGVILDQSLDYERTEDEGWQTEGKNANAFQLFSNHGLKVFYDKTSTISHNKVLVIDRETVILGSTNWTEYALSRNNESSVLIQSKEFAEHKLSQLTQIGIDQEESETPDIREPPLVLGRILMESPDFFSRMMTASDHRAFDVYLLLLKDFKEDAELIFNYDYIARELGIAEKMDRTAYRRQLMKTLRKLMEPYQLLNFEPHYAKDAEVILLDPTNDKKPYTYPQGNYFKIPGEYFSYGWDQRLLFREKFCYFINLIRASLSPGNPWWSKAKVTLENQFHVQTETLQLGMIGLRRWNLIDMEYSSTETGYANRMSTRYKVSTPYSYEELQRQKKKLVEEFGQERFDQALGWAAIVFEENDPGVLKDILHLTDQFGQEIMDKAFNVVSQKRVDNPKRTYRYVVGIARSEASELSLLPAKGR